VSHQGPISPADLYTQVDVNPGNLGESPLSDVLEEQTELLRDVLSAQDRTNELLEELVGVMAASQKQRSAELTQWKKENPKLAKGCRAAAERLSKVQAEFLHQVVEEVNDSGDVLMEGDFMLNEFVDRFGPRLAHLNGVIQVLAQLSSGSQATKRP